jgi:fatty-acid peroxygenase
MPIDETVTVALEGYAWLPDHRRRSADGVVDTRVGGQRALGLCGPEAARFFYDERNVIRHGAIPEPVQGTLFGKRAVHTLDGERHRVRKAMFVSMLTGGGVTALVDSTMAAWSARTGSWRAGEPVVLFEEASRVITEGVHQWAGVPLDEADVADTAADLIAMVDGFTSAGPRHWRARRARGRQERQLCGLVEQIRSGRATAPAGSILATVAAHRDADGRLLDPEVAAVELLNVVRPTVAVSWFVTYAAHALHRWPQQRERLRFDDAYVEAFVHETRRYYPFAPFIGGRAARDLEWKGRRVPAGRLVLLDLYGQNHHPDLWTDPDAFAPERFLDREIGAYELVPQGGGDPRTGHRCPGEQITIALLKSLVAGLARLPYEVPPQDLDISLRRIPARVPSGMRIIPPAWA